MPSARIRSALCAAAGALALAGCGSTTLLHRTSSSATPATPSAPAPAPVDNGAHASSPRQLGFPDLATKNTTRVAGSDPVADAAAVALAVYPSAVPGTHPPAVALAPTDDWQAALAASSLMASPFRAPVLLSGPGTLPHATAEALKALAPTGADQTGRAQVLQIGDTPTPSGYKTASIAAHDPYAGAAAIDAYEAKRRGRESIDVVIASGQQPAWAMPAAGWAAQSGEPVLYVTDNAVPAATAAALSHHHHAHIYVLGPASVISDQVLTSLGRYGKVKRISAPSPAALSVTFAAYRDPPCPANNQPCGHLPGSFGWAIRDPGHGYVLLNQDQPLAAAAAAPLSASGSYGPQLLLSSATALPQPVLNYFVGYATPGYSSNGPTTAVYNHAWLIGDDAQISPAVQAQVDNLLELVPVKTQ